MSFVNVTKTIAGCAVGHKESTEKAEVWAQSLPRSVKTWSPLMVMLTVNALVQAKLGDHKIAAGFAIADYGALILASTPSVRKNLLTPPYAGYKFSLVTVKASGLALKHAFRLAGLGIFGTLSTGFGVLAEQSLSAGIKAGSPTLGVIGLAINGAVSGFCGYSAVQFYRGFPRSEEPMKWGSVRDDLIKARNMYNEIPNDIRHFRDRIGKKKSNGSTTAPQVT